MILMSLQLHNGIVHHFLLVSDAGVKKREQSQHKTSKPRSVSESDKARSVSESDQGMVSKTQQDLTKSPKSDSGSKKPDRRARFWKFLFDNLQRAVDAIYETCEQDESEVECKVRLIGSIITLQKGQGNPTRVSKICNWQCLGCQVIDIAI